MESSFDLKLSSFPTPLTSKPSKASQRFCSIDAVSNEALIFSFEKRSKNNPDGTWKVQSYDLFSESNKQAAWAMEDFDGNGLSDLVVSDSSLGELLFLPGKPHGQFCSAQEIPSLRGVSELHPIGVGNKLRPSLLILSRDEEALGLNFDKGLSFPEMIPIKVPLARCFD